MRSTVVLSLLSLSAVLAAPGLRTPQHHHHVKRDQDVVYETVQVTEYITMTAGQSVATSVISTISTSTPAGNVALAVSYFQHTSATTLTTSTLTPAAVSEQSTTSSVSPTAKATSSPVVSSTPTTASGGKKGLAWPSDNPSAMTSLFNTGAASWYFNWGTGATSGLSSLTFIYEQWGTNNIANIKTIPTGSTLIGFNEPDQAGQSTMTAAQAAALYKSDFTPLRKSGQIAYLGTPSITNGGGSAGIVWLTEFMSLCSDCQIDFVSAHWYGPSLSLLQSQMTAIHTAFGLPVWVTEMAATNWNAATNPSASDISTFMTQAEAWLESTSWIAKYAWFGSSIITDASLGTANSLVTSDGSALSSLGKQYMNQS